YSDSKTDKHEDPIPPDQRVQDSGFRVQKESLKFKVQDSKFVDGKAGLSTPYSVPSTADESADPRPAPGSLPSVRPSHSALRPESAPRSPVQILALRCAEVGIDPTGQLG